MKKSLLKVFVIWALTYPLATMLLLGIQELNLSLSLGLKTFIMTLILVPLMFFYIVPLVNSWFSN